MDKVTICVPVYNAEDFVTETINSIILQTHTNIEILISIDKSTDQSFAICKAFLTDPRIKFFQQCERLGWVKNINFLLAKVNTEFFCVIPHDDIIAPNYIQQLLLELINNPKAIASYCDLTAFGEHDSTLIQPSLTGLAYHRAQEFLMCHHSAVAFRGLIRIQNTDQMQFLPENSLNNFAVDTTWVFQLSCLGELRRVASPLYYKRTGVKNSARNNWEVNSWCYWLEHCLDCSKVIISSLFSNQEKRALLQSCKLRLLKQTPGHFVGPPGQTLSKTDRINLVNQWNQTITRILKDKNLLHLFDDSHDQKFSNSIDIK